MVTLAKIFGKFNKEEEIFNNNKYDTDIIITNLYIFFII